MADAPATPAAAAPETPAAPATPPDASAAAAAKAAAVAPPAQTPAEIRKLKVKIENQEMEVPEDELVKGYQLARTSYNRLERAAKAQKDVQSFWEAFNKDPRAAFIQAETHRLGSKEKAVESWHKIVLENAAKKIETDQLPPEEKQFREREEALAERERLLKEQADKNQQAQVAHAQKIFEGEIDKALPIVCKEAGLPTDLPKQTQNTIYRAVLELWQTRDAAGVPCSLVDCAKEVRELRSRVVKEVALTHKPAEIRSLLPDLAKSLIESYTVDEFRAAFPDLAKKLRAADLEAVKPAAAAAPATPAREAPKPTRDEPRRKLRGVDFVKMEEEAIARAAANWGKSRA